MSNKSYSQEFKEEALKQIRDRGYSVLEVSKRLGVSSQTLYKWLGGTLRSDKKEQRESDLALELARVKSALKRAEEERDILKKAAAYFAKESL